MLIVHHLGQSQSERIVWLCEELEIPYTLNVYCRDPVTRLAPSVYKTLHPMGIAPVITDDNLVLAESGAIVEYLLAKYGNGRLSLAPSNPNFATYLFWLHFANGTLMPSESFAMLSSPSMGFDISPEHPLLATFQARTDRAYAMLEQHLGKTKYLAGTELTAADIMMVFPLTTMRLFTGRNLAAYPSIREYLSRIGARPAYRAAVTKGDPDLEPLLT
jgi:glutathione S-transferase